MHAAAPAECDSPLLLIRNLSDAWFDAGTPAR